MVVLTILEGSRFREIVSKTCDEPGSLRHKPSIPCLQPCTSKPSFNTSPHITMADGRDLEKAPRAQLREEAMRQLKIDSRFSQPFGVRLPLATSLSFLVGMGLGLSHGSQVAGLRFRAENAHRLPTSPTGWYLYHKSKNYQMAFGGVKEGFKMGAKVSFWTAGFFYIEDVFDRYRGTKDFINTVIASLSVAGAFSLWSMHLQTLLHPSPQLITVDRFPVTTAARTAKTSLAIGVMYGLAQDAVGALRGRKPGYVDFIQRRGRRKAEIDQPAFS
jgi:hypothetical protein